MLAVPHLLLSGLGGGALERPVDRAAADAELVGDVLHGVAPAAVMASCCASRVACSDEERRVDRPSTGLRPVAACGTSPRQGELVSFGPS
jgi:hypothetical protein